MGRQGLELITRYLRPGCCRGSNRISQVPGEPQLSVCTCSKPTPAGLLAPDRCGAAAWPLVIERQRLPQLGLSTLHSMAFGLAAGTVRSMVGFAGPVTRHHARHASRCWSGSPGRGSHPQGSAERSQICDLHFIPLSQALLGASASTCADGGPCQLAAGNLPSDDNCS